MTDLNPDTSTRSSSVPGTLAGAVSQIALVRAQGEQKVGRVIFVHGNDGSDSPSRAGESWGNPLMTMAAAFDLVESGDTIRFVGNIKEQLVTPAGIFDVTIQGGGNRPRHADAHTGSNGYQTATWKAPDSPTASTPLLRIQQQGWKLENILFSGQTGYAQVSVVRNADAGDDERDGSHAEIVGCRFAGGLDGIRVGRAATFTENVFDVRIAGNQFNDLTGTAIVGINGWRFLIENNQFMANANHLVVPLTQSVIRDNTFGKVTTAAITTTGGANNSLYRNSFAGTYSNAGGYTGVASDEWGGNYNVISGGITAADPA